jgi:hypothetical protein
MRPGRCHANWHKYGGGLTRQGRFIATMPARSSSAGQRIGWRGRACFATRAAFGPPFFTSIRRCRLGAILGENSGAPLIGGSAGSRSHLGCQISRNFHASADFDNDRSGPAHGLLLQARLRPRGLSPIRATWGSRPSNTRPVTSIARTGRRGDSAAGLFGRLSLIDLSAYR